MFTPFDEQRAFLLSIGEGEKSRIYQTVDGGTTWALRFTNRDPRGFLDAIAFWDADHGIAMGDAVDGRFTILTTGDGGATWKRSPARTNASGMKGEGAFAASGTCLVVEGERNAWFGTGGAAVARVFRSTDRGQSWTVHETPIAAGKLRRESFRWRFATPLHGVAVGGDYKAPEQATHLVAKTSDGGLTWTAPHEAWAGRISIGRLVCAGNNQADGGRGRSHRVGSLDAMAAKHGCRWARWDFMRSASLARSTPAGESATTARSPATMEPSNEGNKLDGDQADPPSATSR